MLDHWAEKVSSYSAWDGREGGQEGCFDAEVVERKRAWASTGPNCILIPPKRFSPSELHCTGVIGDGDDGTLAHVGRVMITVVVSGAEKDSMCR